MSEKEKELADLRRLQKASHVGRINDDAKSRFKKIVAKKFRTCFIYAIAEFENCFGEELWGHGLQEDTLTDEQLANKRRWDRVRKNILDKGNTQSRAVMSEVNLHNMEFNGYKLSFGSKDDG